MSLPARSVDGMPSASAEEKLTSKPRPSWCLTWVTHRAGAATTPALRRRAKSTFLTLAARLDIG